MSATAERYDALKQEIAHWRSCLVAYSGGVDSAFLALVAHQVLGDRSLAVIADSPSLPRRELAEACDLAARFQFKLRVIHTREFANPEYTSNPVNRCYFCKHELFTTMEQTAREDGFAVLAYGENASDVGDFRPGSQAARELQVRAPLKDAGLTKADIRELSAALGLPTADKPAMPCLSSRIPHGEIVTPEKLQRVESAEQILRELGFKELRVRHHEPALETADQPTVAPLARIEVAREELPRMLSLEPVVGEALKQAGYSRVIIDRQGYRRGSLNPQTG